MKTKKTNKTERYIINEESQLEFNSHLDDANLVKEIDLKPIRFKNEKQKQFYNLCRDDNVKMVVCDGPAGTGKGYCAIHAALRGIKSGKYDKIIYIRVAEDSSDSKLGFLPGDLKDKTCNYMFPLEEKLSMFLTHQHVKMLKNKEFVEEMVPNFIRGRSIDKAFVIIDEVQNISYPKDIKTILTRWEEKSKLVLIGDHTQSDIGLKSCLTKIRTIFDDSLSKENGIKTFQFDKNDIVRSGLTKFIVDKFEEYEKLSRS